MALGSEAAPAWRSCRPTGTLRYDEGTFIDYHGRYAQQAPAPAFCSSPEASVTSGPTCRFNETSHVNRGRMQCRSKSRKPTDEDT